MRPKRTRGHFIACNTTKTYSTKVLLASIKERLDEHQQNQVAALSFASVKIKEAEKSNYRNKVNNLVNTWQTGKCFADAARREYSGVEQDWLVVIVGKETSHRKHCELNLSVLKAIVPIG